MSYIPFGKHQGKEISRLPLSYLKWLTTADIDPPLAAEVRDELARRGTKIVSARLVLSDVEETIYRMLDESPNLEHETCGVLSDIVLEATDEVRQRHGIRDETALLIEPRPAAQAVAVE